MIKTKETESHIEGILSFLNSENQVLSISGGINSGKEDLHFQIKDLAKQSNFTSTTILAYNRRLAKQLSIANDQTIFNTIYNLNHKMEDEEYTKYFPLKKLIKSTYVGSELYIICNSHLITNSSNKVNNIVFGSGNLQEDIFTYLDLENNPKCKVIFIGDENKISFIDKSINIPKGEGFSTILNEKNISLEVKRYKLPDIESDSEIVKTCQKIAGKLKEENFSSLDIKENNEIKVPTKPNYNSMMEDCYRNPFASKFLVYSNQQAREINQQMKSKLLKNGSDIAAEDIIIFNSTTMAYPSWEEAMKYPENTPSGKVQIVTGEFGKVIHIEKEKQIIKTINLDNGFKIELKFIPALIELENNISIETLIFENYLNKEDKYIDEDESKAYQKLLSKLDKESMDYFKIYNAVRVNYGWAMTVHRGMTYSFENIYFDSYRTARTNANYYSWLYSGISIARENVHLLNWGKISPFENTEYKEIPASTKKPEFSILTFEEDLKDTKEEIRQLLLNNIESINKNHILVDSKNYLEQATIQINGQEAKLNFHYKKNGEVKPPIYSSGSKEVFHIVEESLPIEKKSIPGDIGPIVAILEDLASLLIEKQIETSYLGNSNYKITLQFYKNTDEIVNVDIYYNNKNLITRFNNLQGSKDLFLEVKEIIKTNIN